nr:TorF family putative porin [Oceanococcus sp. HetDA_MAG_MS8]
MMNSKRFAQAALIAGVAVSGSAMAELSGNLTVNNNYVWRGLTQTTNEASVSGGMDYAHESGFYAGTWISNVQYGADDNYSYEHDLYFGLSGGDTVAWDVGYLYYNYDNDTNFDFGEVYFSLGMGGLSATAYVLTNTEAAEGPGQDFGAGEATYLSLDYGFETANGLGISFHVGSHDGDFVEAFNGIEGYMDYNVTIAKNGFGLMVSKTDIEEDESTGSQGSPGLSNDDFKFVVSYSVDFDLNP